jgi:hypothetical protein
MKVIVAMTLAILFRWFFGLFSGFSSFLVREPQNAFLLVNEFPYLKNAGDEVVAP